MSQKKVIIEQLWAKQQISTSDVDYTLWNQKKESIRQLAKITPGCLFTVDVFKGVYDFASERFTQLFGFNPHQLHTISKQKDLLEDKIHPDDREQLFDFQIEHGNFIYTLPVEQRNDYQQVFQYRMLNTKREYINVISRQQVIQQDNNGKAWIIMGIMDISPDQKHANKVIRTVINRKTGEILSTPAIISSSNPCLTSREKEILLLIQKGMLSKEIADRLGRSIHTIHNHRKNILAKLQADNSIEAITYAKKSGIL